MTALPVREPKKLCGMPYSLGRQPGEDEDDIVYCGLQYPHADPHMAMVWWYGDEPAVPAEGSRA